MPFSPRVGLMLFHASRYAPRRYVMLSHDDDTLPLFAITPLRRHAHAEMPRHDFRCAA